MGAPLTLWGGTDRLTGTALCEARRWLEPRTSPRGSDPARSRTSKRIVEAVNGVMLSRRRKPEKRHHVCGARYAPERWLHGLARVGPDSDDTQIVVADSGTSSLLVFPVPGEIAGDAFRHPFRYAP